jgi:hypothetical protein
VSSANTAKSLALSTMCRKRSLSSAAAGAPLHDLFPRVIYDTNVLSPPKFELLSGSRLPDQAGAKLGGDEAL